MQGQAEARQLLVGPGHQNSAADVKLGEPQVSVHVLDAGIFRVGEGAVEDRHVVLQPVRDRRFRGKGRSDTLMSVFLPRNVPPAAAARG